MRRSIPTTTSVPPSPAMWYDANGYKWGQIGPKGELLDSEGQPLTEETPNYLLAFVWLFILVAIAVGLAWVLTEPTNATGHPVPFHTPATYDAPPTWYAR